MAQLHAFQTSLVAADHKPRLGWFSSSSLKREITRLHAALKDAEMRAARQLVLTREADHRIKNNLQVVASLVRGGARREQVSGPADSDAVAARIDQIANLHDLLQLAPDSDVVDLGALLHRMRQSIEAITAVEPRRIEVLLEAGSIAVPAAYARPVMMVVSELVMNAIRHAFPDGRRGTIRITAAVESGVLRVVVADDGVGLPPASADGSGFGMKLARAMASQIGGTLAIETDRGARFTLVAPLPGR